jgi:hypothetical protein
VTRCSTCGREIAAPARGAELLREYDVARAAELEAERRLQGARGGGDEGEALQRYVQAVRVRAVALERLS